MKRKGRGLDRTLLGERKRQRERERGTQRRGKKTHTHRQEVAKKDLPPSLEGHRRKRK